ncbi:MULTISPECIES: hypothetical protein [unclassified Bradyrhizobium]|uniref:hypothetical protein n=1 Tax=unclassified Bradyrhizobium TaxID=2631580 RepID=UPI002FF26766
MKMIVAEGNTHGPGRLEIMWNGFISFLVMPLLLKRVPVFMGHWRFQPSKLEIALRGLPPDTPKQTVRDIFHTGWRYAWLWEADVRRTELERLLDRRKDSR